MIVNCKTIKRTVEGVSGVEDISIRRRKGNLPQIRFVYFKLCEVYKRELKFPSLETIGKEVKRNHATVLHGLKAFEIDNKTNHNGISDLYNECLDELAIIMPDVLTKEQINENIKRHFRIKSIIMQKKYREVINSLRCKLKYYKENEIIENQFTDVLSDLKKLSDTELQQFKETRLKPFITMLNNKNN